jgi:hypothetical protein
MHPQFQVKAALVVLMVITVATMAYLLGLRAEHMAAVVEDITYVLLAEVGWVVFVLSGQVTPVNSHQLA